MATSGASPTLVTIAVLLTLAVFAITCLVYALVEQCRRRVWKTLAATLDGTFTEDSTGYGCVEAVWEDRVCRVRAERVHRSIVTVVEVDGVATEAPESGVALPRACFGPVTDWSDATTEGRRPQRVLITTVLLPAAMPLDDGQRAWLDDVFDADGGGPSPAEIADAMESIEARAIRVEPMSCSIRYSGIVTDLERLRSTLAVLCGVARRLEAVSLTDDPSLQPAA